MGIIHRVACKNTSCGYCKDLRYGTGWIRSAERWQFQEAILYGEEEFPEVAEILKNDGELHNYGIYLCPTCKEYVTHKEYYCLKYVSLFFEVYDYDGVEEEIYDVVFPFGIPKCDQCGSALKYIDEEFFDYTSCPKCGDKAPFVLHAFFD